MILLFAVWDVPPYLAVAVVTLLVVAVILLLISRRGEFRAVDVNRDDSQPVSPGPGTRPASGQGASDLSPEVQRLAREGQKIVAIKLHREETGLSLKDAKDAVESFQWQQN